MHKGVFLNDKIAMDTPNLTRIHRKRLCLKSTLDKCQYDPVTKVYSREIEKTVNTKQPTASPEIDEEEEDLLEDFKSPVKKVEKKVKKKVSQRPDKSRTYTYPEGIFCTQDMFVHAYLTSEVQNPPSEDEFEIYTKDKKEKEEYIFNKTQFLAKFGKVEKTPPAAPPTLKPLSILETARSAPTEPLLVDIKNGIEEGVGNSAPKTESDFLPPQCSENSKSAAKIKHSLRTELKKIKIKDIIIADSDASEDEVPASQAVCTKRFKIDAGNSSSKSVELKILEEASVNTVFPTTEFLPEPTVVQEKTAYHIMPIVASPPLSMLNVDQSTVIKKSNEKKEMVPLLEDTQDPKKEMDTNATSSPSLQSVKIHSSDETSSSKNLLLETSIVQATKSDWCVNKRNNAFNKPSRRSHKCYCCKKFRFSYIRTLKWKTKMFKRKKFLYLRLADLFGMWNKVTYLGYF